MSYAPIRELFRPSVRMIARTRARFLSAIDELGKATRIQGDPSHPVTRGFLCGKVAKYLDRVYSPARLLQPMRRRAGRGEGRRCPLAARQRPSNLSGGMRRLDLIAERLGTISAVQHGPESILPYSYAGTIGSAWLWLHGSPLLSSAGRLAARSHHLRYRRRRCPGVGLREKARH